MRINIILVISILFALPTATAQSPTYTQAVAHYDNSDVWDFRVY